ncbi:CocE/NonD family hydrolase [Streptomyces sp. NPDC056500]|uniref:CocE/NonD family hydrolase n=1 Tax=Streptomyces sp. NPDC056500 TaxID=3345840 RepID=UPI00369FA66A
MRHRRRFPYETSHEDLWIPLAASGTHESSMLYARVWRPLTPEPVPALLEYAPDRLGDSTAARDAQRHPWYAGQGYASVRVDARGHGSSQGIPDASAALPDGLAVIAWLAAQPWCNGRIGAFGLGVGAGWALRLAALSPGPLGAVVAVCAPQQAPVDAVLARPDHARSPVNPSPAVSPAVSDAVPVAVRVAVPADVTLSRSADLLAALCLPPDPHHTDASWRALWLNRLEALAPCSPDGPPPPDAQFPAGGRPPPVLVVSGWRAPDHDDVLARVARAAPPDRVRGLIGPWSAAHYPDHGLPGPAIGFLQETLRWFDRHLRTPDADIGTPGEPLLRCWIGGHRAHWAADTRWPPLDLTRTAYPLHGLPVTLEPDVPRSGLPSPDAADPLADDTRAICWDFPTDTEPVEVLGHPRVTLRLQPVKPQKASTRVVARLWDVAPDGSPTLVTSGVLTLAATPGSTKPATTFPLDSTGYTFAPGHRVRLALSCPYWPWHRPAPLAAPGTLHPEGSRLELPVRVHPSPDEGPWPFDAPEQAEPLGINSPATLDPPHPGRRTVQDGTTGPRLETVPHGVGTFRHPDGLEVTVDALDVHSARGPGVDARRTIRLHRPDASWDVSVETHSALTRDESGFVTRDEVVCRSGPEIVFHRTWQQKMP